MNDERKLLLSADQIVKMWEAAGTEPNQFRSIFDLTADLADQQQQQPQPRKRTAPPEKQPKKRLFREPKLRKQEQLSISDATAD